MNYEQQLKEEWTHSIFADMQTAQDFIDTYLYERGLQFREPVPLPDGEYRIEHTDY